MPVEFLRARLYLYCFMRLKKCGSSYYMFFMSTSMVLYRNLVLSNNISSSDNSFSFCNAFHASIRLPRGSRRLYPGLVPNAKKRHKRGKRSWWQRFFFDEDANWLGLKEEFLVDELELEKGSSSDELSENEKFEAWKNRAEAIVELREAQEEAKNEDNRRWEDWLVDGTDIDIGSGESWFEESNGVIGKAGNDIKEDSDELFSGRGLVKSMRNLVVGGEDDDILYEDRVFRYASFNSAKFLAVLIIVPWALDFLVHDYVLLPFLDRYVKTVPFAAEMLDVRKSQKLEMVKSLNIDKARYRLEVEIGKSPPLSDEEFYLELRHKALELREEWRLENRKAFANIWSDMVFGVSLFFLLYFNQSRVALLKFTGYKIVNNVTDTGKAFLIILTTDIFLGYHSEMGWEALLEIIIEHYGFEVDRAAIIIFVCIIPVLIDACVKLWLFKFLPRLSPKVLNIFQEMRRH